MNPINTSKAYKAKIEKEYYKIQKKIAQVRENYVNDEYTDREYCCIEIPLEERLKELMHIKKYLH